MLQSLRKSANRQQAIVTAHEKSWLKEEVFQDGDLFFQSLERDLLSAKYVIYLETYIFNTDALGSKILECLKKAASNGVWVRVLLDGIGSLYWTYDQAQALAKHGVYVKFFHPLPWQIKRSDILKFFNLKLLFQRLIQVNRRNHRKSCVIDYEIAYVGGMNISSNHMKSLSGDLAWKDCAVKVQGKEVSHLVFAFERAWSNWPERDLDRVSNPPEEAFPAQFSSLLRLNDTRAKRRAKYRDLVHRIDQAKYRIWITTPYLVPEFSLLRALKQASKRGVDVKILVPFKNDVFFMRRVNQAFYRYLLRSGVQIYEYIPSILHSKIMLIDQWGTVGSSNLNHRSLLHDLEVDAVLTYVSSIKALEHSFCNDLKASRKILRSHRKHDFFSSLINRITLVFKHWL